MEETREMAFSAKVEGGELYGKCFEFIDHRCVFCRTSLVSERGLYDGVGYIFCGIYSVYNFVGKCSLLRDESLFWAFAYNALLIPMAAGLYPSIQMNPMWGAAAMSLSSFTVCMNALRLNMLNIHDSKKDRPIRHKAKQESEGEKEMKKTMKIEGMMCSHCEASVKKALEAIDGVESAEVSHEAGTAIVTMSKEVSNDVLKSAVEAKDYNVTGIE